MGDTTYLRVALQSIPFFCLSCVNALSNYSGYAPPREYRIPCKEAHLYAAKALKANGYAITQVEREASGGIVVGVRPSETMEMRLSCDPSGVWLTPSGETPYAENGMRISFERVAELGARTRMEPTGLEATAELIAGPETQLYFASALQALGLVALRVRVRNGSDRPVDIVPSAIQVRTESGDLRGPIEPGEIERRFASIAPDLLSQILQPARLGRGEGVEGFLFFPPGHYLAAVLHLTDVETGEPEGFESSFPH